MTVTSTVIPTDMEADFTDMGTVMRPTAMTVPMSVHGPRMTVPGRSA
ncbi:hypothetical protein [[Kitasatospora] papulosa]